MRYLTAPDILYLHFRLTKKFGGDFKINNIKVLKKAVSYSHNKDVFPDKFSKAGALLFAISRKKPFTSLNTQTAILTAHLFLKINGSNIDLADPEVATFTKAFLSKAKLEEITHFLKSKSTS